MTGSTISSAPISSWIPDEHFAPLTAWSDTFYTTVAPVYNVGTYDANGFVGSWKCTSDFSSTYKATCARFLPSSSDLNFY